MKKSFMTRVLAVSLSAAMAFSLSSASNLMTASAASTVNLATTFKTLKVKQTYQLKLKNNTLSWKISKVTTSDRTICMVYDKKASSVMLKGKKVGRATVKVTTKTTKRKTNNTKTMSCRVNVKAADTPSTPDTPDVPTTFSMSAVAASATTVNVTFAQAVDEPVAASNFEVSGGSVKVENVALSADKKSATLTIAGAAANTEYTLTAKNLKVNGTAVADTTATFKTPDNSIAISENYTLVLESNLTTPYLKSDGASNALITATLKDKAGNVMTDAKAEVEFTASRGNLANTRVAVQDGKAVNTLRSEFLSSEVVTNITATIVESSNAELIGISSKYQLTMTPNPDAYATSIGAVITSAESNEADRVTAYFDRDVDVNNYLDANKNIDTTKALIDIYSGLNNSFTNSTGTPVNAIGLVAVPGNTKAMQIIVDRPLVDNSNVSVRFRDRNGSQMSDNTVYFKLTDARQPAVQTVKADGYRTLELEFSEAIIYAAIESPGRGYAADNNTSALGDHFMIDGMPLSNVKFGTEANPARVRVGEFVRGADNRNIVTITLGKNASGERIYLKPGKHSIQIANVGDWASNTDAKNILETQTLDFTVEENTLAPAIESVEIQSPEQYLVTFNAPVDKNVLYTDVRANIATGTAGRGNTLMQLREGNTNIGGTDGSNPIVVTAVSADDDGASKQYIVEVTRDWTTVYGTKASRRNYYNYNYSLFIPSNAIENANNGLRNTSDITYALTGAIKEPDEKSPEITGIEKKSGTDYWVATMSEPVKIDGTANNREGLTPSEEQGTDAGVPTPSAEFVKSDNSETIRAEILGFDDLFHKEIRIRPDNNSKTLPGGDWRLVVRTISDDVGNTAATLSKLFNAPAVVKEKNFKVVWAAVVTDADGNREVNYDDIKPTYDGRLSGRYIVVKFSAPVATFGSEANVMSQANYTINGKALPTGTRIEAGIVGYDRKAIQAGADAESITIILPAGEEVNSRNTVLNISDFVTSRNGERLTGDHEIKLPYRLFEELDDTEHDAVWGNHTSESVATLGQAGYIEALKKALDDDAYRTIVFDVSADYANVDLEITRPVNLDLNNSVVLRNVTYSFSEGALIEIKDGRITGKLTINAPYADVDVKNMQIDGVILENVLPDTFMVDRTSKIDKLTIVDPDGIKVENNGYIERVDVNTNGKVTLDGQKDDAGTTGIYGQVTVNKKATLGFRGSAVARKVSVNTGVGAITITQSGNNIEKVIGNAVTVTNTKGERNDTLSQTEAPSASDLNIALNDAKKVLKENIEATSTGAINVLRSEATSSDAITILSIEVKDDTKTGIANYLDVNINSTEANAVSVINQPTTSNTREYIFVTCKVNTGDRAGITVTVEIPVTITKKSS